VDCINLLFFFLLLWLTYGKASVYYEGYSLRASFSIVSAVKDVEAKFITKLSAVSKKIFNGSYCCVHNFLMLISVNGSTCPI
jgi:hypothetical protein